MAPPSEATGSVTAHPNPIPPLAESWTRITWETDDPRGAEIRVSTGDEDEKLVARGARGSVEISWITAGRTYTFKLYGATEPGRCLDFVTVCSSEETLAEVLNRSAAEASGELEQIAHFIAKVAPRCVRDPRYPEFFRLWEENGIHLTPVHFYHPIPDTRTLPESLWNRPGDLAGIDMNDAVQLDLVRRCFPKFREEYEQFPRTAEEAAGQFHFENDLFGGTDALVTYCVVRHYKPRTMIEIGSGYSSLISGQATVKNGDAALVCVEPYPRDFLVRGFPGLRSLIQKKVEDVGLDFFSQLQSGDILFIDSSHTVKIGGDVNFFFLEVLPRLNPGVIVHIHDILFPFDYRRDWVMDECRFWTEQYLLQAFLAFNSQFEVLIANSYFAHHYLKDFQATFPSSPWWSGGSFWMRRREASDPAP